MEEGQAEPLLASGSLDGSARVWRPAEGECATAVAVAVAVAVLQGHDGPVTALAAGVDAVRRQSRGQFVPGPIRST